MITHTGSSTAHRHAGCTSTAA